jgi:putative sterol carrier protein
MSDSSSAERGSRPTMSDSRSAERGSRPTMSDSSSAERGSRPTMSEPVDIDVDTLTPGDFATLVHEADDDTLVATFHQVGTEQALDRIFAIMQDHYRPDRAGDLTATVQWRIDDEGETHPYVVELTAEGCTTARGEADHPTTTLATSLVHFTRIAAGQANGVTLLLRRKLRAGGDVNLARKLPGYFDIPTPGA